MTTQWTPCASKLPPMHRASANLLEMGVERVSNMCLITIRSGTGTFVDGGAMLQDGKWTSAFLDAFELAGYPYDVLAWIPYPEPWKE